MDEESPEGEPVYLELADALELYAAIIAGTVVQAGDHLRDRGVDAPDAELAAWIISLSEGTTPEQLAELIRERIRSLP